MKNARQVAVVTGSARNIGKAIAIEFAKSGVDVVLNGRTASNDLLEVQEEISLLGASSLICTADIST